MPGIAIVGPHRSGTSAVAGVFHELGFYMGSDLLPPSKSNPRGYFEDARIVNIHNEMMGGNWYLPDLNMTPDLMDRYVDVVSDFTDHQFYAIKDPRLCYTLPALVDATLGTIKVVAVYRDPWYSAHSLAKRDNMPFSKALNITLAYYQRMILNTYHSEVFRIRYTDLLVKRMESTAALAKFAGMTERDFDKLSNAVLSIDPTLAHWEVKDAQKIIMATGGVTP